MNRRIHSALVALPLALGLPMAQAADLNTINALAQTEFRLLTEDLGAALSFKPLVPSEATGIAGFDLGLAATFTQLQNRAIAERASGGSSVPSSLPVPTIRLHKGLPLDIDVGLMYGAVPGASANLVGGEVRWAALPGSTTTPAVAIRLAATSLSGVDQLGLRTTSADISISKGFAMFTPYGGVGTVRTKGTPKNVSSLSAETVNQSKVFAGVNINLGFNLALEFDRTGDATTYGAKLGIRF